MENLGEMALSNRGGKCHIFLDGYTKKRTANFKVNQFSGNSSPKAEMSLTTSLAPEESKAGIIPP